MKSSLLIYPYTQKYDHFVRYSDLLPDYRLASLVLPSGTKLEDHVFDIDLIRKLGVRVSSDFNTEIHSCDSVLFTSHPNDYEKRVEQATTAGKQVLSFKKKHIGDVIDQMIGENDTLNRIEAPVIMVYGQGERTEKFDIQLHLRSQFIKDGYRVLSYGTKEYSSIFEMNVLPDVSELPIWKKAICINRIVHKQSTKMKPDVIVVGVPGGIMPVNNIHTQFFGEYAFAYSVAIKPDISIISFYENLASEVIADKTALYMKHCFGSGPDFIHVAHTRIKPSGVNERTSYLHVDDEMVNKSMARLHNSLISYSCHDRSHCDLVYTKIIEKLSDNVPVLF